MYRYITIRIDYSHPDFIMLEKECGEAAMDALKKPRPSRLVKKLEEAMKMKVEVVVGADEALEVFKEVPQKRLPIISRRCIVSSFCLPYNTHTHTHTHTLYLFQPILPGQWSGRIGKSNVFDSSFNHVVLEQIIQTSRCGGVLNA